MPNLVHWNNLKTVPKEALREINFGKLKGKSDINPQWRYEVMTNEFGVCGIGWKYEIIKTWTQEVKDEVLLFVEIALYVKDGEQWSAPIPAIGGDFVIEKDKNGIHGNDEAYKMATTDALGVAMKMLGVAADVYRGLTDDSKYRREPKQQIAQKPIPKITEPQMKQLMAKASENGIADEQLKLAINKKYKLSSKKDLTQQQATELINNMPKISAWLKSEVTFGGNT